MLRTQQTSQNGVLELLDDMVEALGLVEHIDRKAVVVDQLKRSIDSLKRTMTETVEFVEKWTNLDRSRIQGE